jgi:hypothetical protein
MHPDSALASAAAELAIVARELGLLIDRITDAATTARGLSGATDWQARAATVFHETADAWAGEVSGLVCVAETARLDAVAAWHRVALMAASMTPDPRLPAGAR